MALAPTAWRARLVAAAFLAISLWLLLSPSASAQVAGIKMAAPAGTQWEVLAGYNTATHEGVDPYALDVWRVDAETGGTPLLAPFSGTIGYTSDTCVSVRNSDVNLLMCHVFAEPGLNQGDSVVVGQRLGTVAPDGQAENAGIAHIHLQLNLRNGDFGSSSGTSLPFAGAYAIEGVNFEATTAFNGHAGRRVTSTNGEVSGAPSVDAGTNRTVQTGASVTPTAQVTGASDVFWAQQNGTPVLSNVVVGSTLSFVAPSETGTLTFSVFANASGTLITDEVQVTVVASPAPPPQTATPSIVAGQVFPGGISLVVYSGGSTDELVEAIACPFSDLGIWASSSDGRLVSFSPARPAFTNAAWNALFPAGLPELTPLILTCG